MDGEPMGHALHSLVGCHGCDLVQRAPVLHPGESAHCVRCGTPLYRRSSNAIERSLALSVTALFLWLVANG